LLFSQLHPTACYVTWNMVSASSITLNKWMFCMNGDKPHHDSNHFYSKANLIFSLKTSSPFALPYQDTQYSCHSESKPSFPPSSLVTKKCLIPSYKGRILL
jgi:hypothetical protein